MSQVYKFQFARLNLKLAVKLRKLSRGGFNFGTTYVAPVFL